MIRVKGLEFKEISTSRSDLSATSSLGHFKSVLVHLPWVCSHHMSKSEVTHFYSLPLCDGISCYLTSHPKAGALKHYFFRSWFHGSAVWWGLGRVVFRGLTHDLMTEVSSHSWPLCEPSEDHLTQGGLPRAHTEVSCSWAWWICLCRGGCVSAGMTRGAGSVPSISQQLAWLCSLNGKNKSSMVSWSWFPEPTQHHFHHIILIEARPGDPDSRSDGGVEIHEKRGAIKYCGYCERRKKILGPSSAPEKLKTFRLHLHEVAKVRVNLRSADFRCNLLSTVSITHKVIVWIKIN